MRNAKISRARSMAPPRGKKTERRISILYLLIMGVIAFKNDATRK